MTNNYAQAIFELFKNGQPVDQVLSSVRKTMGARGHDKLYSAVLSAVVVLLEEDEAKNQATIILADVSARDSSQVKNALAVLGAEVSSATTTIDPTIIGGSIVTYKNQQIDQSYKTALKNLYQSITTN